MTDGNRTEPRQKIVHLEESATSAARDQDLASFSTAGIDELASSVSAYVHDLVVESKRLATREGLDGVSATHVERARSSMVVRRSSRTYQVLGNCGAVLLGVVIPNVFLIVDASQPSAFLVVGTIASGVIGGVLVMAQWTRI
jgi:hypothetical protein